MQLETTLQASRKDGGLERALENVISAERKAFIGALKCIYFLNKREIAHTTNFIPLHDLAKSLGVEYLNDLGNAAYRSERFVQQILSALGQVMKQKIATIWFFCLDDRWNNRCSCTKTANTLWSIYPWWCYADTTFADDIDSWQHSSYNSWYCEEILWWLEFRHQKKTLWSWKWWCIGYDGCEARSCIAKEVPVHDSQSLCCSPPGTGLWPSFW